MRYYNLVSSEVDSRIKQSTFLRMINIVNILRLICTCYRTYALMGSKIWALVSIDYKPRLSSLLYELY